MKFILAATQNFGSSLFFNAEILAGLSFDEDHCDAKNWVKEKD